MDELADGPLKLEATANVAPPNMRSCVSLSCIVEWSMRGGGDTPPVALICNHIRGGGDLIGELLADHGPCRSGEIGEVEHPEVVEHVAVRIGAAKHNQALHATRKSGREAM